MRSIGIPAARRARTPGQLTIAQRRADDLAAAAAAEGAYREVVRAHGKRADAAAAMGRDDAGPKTQMRGGASPTLRSSLRGQAASGTHEDMT